MILNHPLVFRTQTVPGGPNLLNSAGFGTTWWVNSSTGSTSGGLSPDTPLSTLAAAITAASAGDTIYVMEGHNEGIANAQIGISKAGLKIIGLGYGSRRPRFDFDHANASIDITANDCYLANLTLLPSVTIVSIGIDINASVTGTELEDIEVLPGEDGAGVDEFVLGIDLKAGCDDTIIRRFKYRQHASADGTNAGISLTGASDNVTIEDPDINLVGTAAVAPIKGITTLSTNVRILRGLLTTDAEPGIELLTGTTGIIAHCLCFTNLATINAAIVADGCALYENYYVEVGGESGVRIGTQSAND